MNLNKFSKKLKKDINKNFPKLSLFLNSKLRIFFLDFKNERLAQKGKSISKSEKPTILLFTAHKCASTFTSKVVGQLAEAANMIEVNFARFFIYNKKSYQLGQADFLKKAFFKKGYYYGPFRSFKNLPDIEEYRILLILRDPRDVLTSHYFSTAFSHPIMNKNIYDERQKALQQTIDEYVMTNAEKTREYYKDYCEKALPLPNTLFLKYEDMISDFEPWFRKLATHINMDENKELIENIIANSNFKVEKENKYSHIRSIKSGDYLDKLKPETIEFLNEFFKDELKALGYE